MRCRGWTVGCLMVGCLLTLTSGCMSLQEHQRLQAAHRSLSAEREAIAQELFDARGVNDSLRTRVSGLEREMGTKGELITNLRQENDLLSESRKTALSALENMGAQQALGDITIAGPALPQQLDSALKRFADQHPSAVVYDAARGTIKWKADLLFALGSDIVKDSSQAALRGFAEIIKSPLAADFEVIVVGHTDNRPIVKASTKAKHPTNWHLSAHRAISVSGAINKHGYPASLIGIMGYGSYRPTADNATDSGAAQNRRVEIYLVPRGAIVQASAGWPANGEAVALASLTK